MAQERDTRLGDFTDWLRQRGLAPENRIPDSCAGWSDSCACRRHDPGRDGRTRSESSSMSLGGERHPTGGFVSEVAGSFKALGGFLDSVGNA